MRFIRQLSGFAEFPVEISDCRRWNDRCEICIGDRHCFNTNDRSSQRRQMQQNTTIQTENDDKN